MSAADGLRLEAALTRPSPSGPQLLRDGTDALGHHAPMCLVVLRSITDLILAVALGLASVFVDPFFLR